MTALGQKRLWYSWSEMCEERCFLLVFIRRWVKFHFPVKHRITVPLSTQGFNGYLRVKYGYEEYSIYTRQLNLKNKSTGTSELRPTSGLPKVSANSTQRATISSLLQKKRADTTYQPNLLFQMAPKAYLLLYLFSVKCWQRQKEYICLDCSIFIILSQ